LKLVVLKLDPSGNLQFQKLVGNGTEYGQSVGLDSTGNIYATATSTGGNSPKILVVKFDSTGGPLWQKTWDGNRTDGSNGLAIDSSGNLDIVGSTNSYGAGGTCGSTVCSDILLLKLDGSGNIISQLVYGSPNVNDQANAVADLFGTMVVVGTVNSAPPYQTSSGNNTLAISSFSIQSQGNSTLGTPAATIVSPNGGSLLTPSGGRTYSGGSDQIILRFGDLPRLSFATSPGTGGTITVNGTTYSNGQTGSFPIGNATLTAVAPSGYAFTSWNSTGGISVSSPTASTTQVSVTGSGTLTAQFQQTSSTADYALYYISAGAAAAAAISIIGVVMYRRRKRPSGPG